jgi:transposase
MLPAPAAPRKRSARPSCFRPPPFDGRHPDWLRLDASLPPDHHARWLASVVARLDLTALSLSYKGYGSLAYPVEILLAFVLFMYCQGTLSPARWAREARYDDRAKWLLRGLRPCRSLLYAFRDRCEPFLPDLNRQLITWAVLEGVTAAARASLDGTFVASLASRHQLLSARRLDRRVLLLRLLVWIEQGHDESLAARLGRLGELAVVALAVLALELAHGVTRPKGADTLLALLELLAPGAPGQAAAVRLPAWVPATPQGRLRVLRRHEEAGHRLAQRLRPPREKQKPSKKDERALKRARVSVTDPEAALGWDKVGTYRPLYNVVLLQAADAPLTLAFDVLARNNDDGLLRPMLEKAKGQLGRHPTEVLADGAFVSVGDAVWCEEQGIEVYAPAGGAEGGRAPAGQKGEKLPKKAFRYEEKEGAYYCPEGKRLERAGRTKAQAGGGMTLPVIVYRAQATDCAGCSRRESCTSSKKGRAVKRYEGEEAVQRIGQRVATAEGKAVYRQRCRSVELGYADLKEHRGLWAFRGFGLKRARAQAGLAILASNGVKLMHILRRRRDPTPPPLTPGTPPP